MAYPDGFNYISGPWTIRRFPVLSTATFRARNPVSVNAAGTVEEYTSVHTAIAGISMSNAADSIYGDEILVGIPTEETVFAVKVQTGVATSALTAFNALDIEKSGNFWRVDTDSTTTLVVTIIPRGDGTTDALSDDSTVNVQFVKDRIAPFGVNTGVAVY